MVLTLKGAGCLQAAQILGNEDLISECRRAALKLTDAALEGMDLDGGLMNEGDFGGVRDTDKHWWPQAEALVGLINAFQISSQEKYLRLAEKIRDLFWIT